MSDGLYVDKIRDNVFDWVNRFIQRPNGVDVAVTWAEGEGGIAAVKADVMSPQPKPPYVSMSLSGPFKTGSDTLEYNSEDDNYTITGHRQFNISIQSFGIGATQDLTRLLGAIELPESLDQLRSKGISISNVPNVQNITTRLQSKFQERAIIEISIYVCHSIVSNVSQIRTVELYFNPDRLLLEDSDFVLKESSDKILLESTVASFTVS